MMKLGVKGLIKLCIYCWGHPLLYTCSGSVAVWMLLSGNLQHATQFPMTRSAQCTLRLDTVDTVDDSVQAAAEAQETQGIRVATSASARNQLVGVDGAIEGIDWIRSDNERHEYDRTAGTNKQIDAYTAALASTEAGFGMVVNAVYAGALPPRAHGQIIHVFTNSRTVLSTLRAPGRKSGQASVSKILKHVRYLEGFSSRVIFAWAQVNPIFELGQRAKQLAQRSTDEGREAQDRVKMSRRTVENA
jgi:hypothetical protein